MSDVIVEVADSEFTSTLPPGLIENAQRRTGGLENCNRLEPSALLICATTEAIPPEKSTPAPCRLGSRWRLPATGARLDHRPASGDGALRVGGRVRVAELGSVLPACSEPISHRSRSAHRSPRRSLRRLVGQRARHRGAICRLRLRVDQHMVAISIRAAIWPEPKCIAVNHDRRYPSVPNRARSCRSRCRFCRVGVPDRCRRQRPLGIEIQCRSPVADELDARAVNTLIWLLSVWTTLISISWRADRRSCRADPQRRAWSRPARWTRRTAD